MLHSKLKPVLTIILSVTLLGGVAWGVAGYAGTEVSPAAIGQGNPPPQNANNGAPAIQAKIGPLPTEQKPPLLYGDKDFAAWRKFLQTQLKPELQIEAIKALRAFGVNGYGEEAAAAIIEVMRKYDAVNALPEEKDVLCEAAGALARIGNPAAAALAEELKSKNVNDRRLAVNALQKLDNEAAVRLAMQALNDNDTTVRNTALWAFQRIVVFQEWPKSITSAEKKSQLPILKAMLDDKDCQIEAVHILGSLGSDARDAVPALIAAYPKIENKGAFISAFESIGSDAKEAVPLIISAYENDRFNGDWALGALDKIEPDARKAFVPAVIAAFSDSRRKSEAIKLLNKLGPDAREALPVVIKALQKVNQKPQLTPDIVGDAIIFVGSFGAEAKAAIPRLIEIRSATDLEDVAYTGNFVWDTRTFPDIKKQAAKALEQIQK